MTNSNAAVNIVPTVKVETDNETINLTIQTKEDAINMANEVERLEAVLKTMKAEMKKYVEANGPIETDDVVWDIKESVSWKFTADELKSVAALIVENGKNPWEIMGITSTNLNKLGWSDDVLEMMGTKKVTRRFSSKKIKK